MEKITNSEEKAFRFKTSEELSADGLSYIRSEVAEKVEPKIVNISAHLVGHSKK